MENTPPIADLVRLARERPGDTSEITDTSGQRYHVDDVAPGLRIHGAPGEDLLVVWMPAADDRPAMWPADVPFAPNLETTVVDRGGERQVQWALPAVDPSDAAESAFRQLTAAGDVVSDRIAAFRNLSGDPDVQRELSAAFDAILRDAKALGWDTEADDVVEMPFPMRRVTLVGDMSKQELVRGGVFGLPMITMRQSRS